MRPLPSQSVSEDSHLAREQYLHVFCTTTAATTTTTLLLQLYYHHYLANRNMTYTYTIHRCFTRTCTTTSILRADLAVITPLAWPLSKCITPTTHQYAFDM